jgi:hypothetical protein
MFILIGPFAYSLFDVSTKAAINYKIELLTLSSLLLPTAKYLG